MTEAMGIITQMGGNPQDTGIDYQAFVRGDNAAFLKRSVVLPSSVGEEEGHSHVEDDVAGPRRAQESGRPRLGLAEVPMNGPVPRAWWSQHEA